ncbi:transglycosylase domain-containing protein [bacterium]|nr:transglycosylase domain-containing protein [bacterium]MCB2179137.1 transglycosylase domain-containing protein [bacterium]
MYNSDMSNHPGPEKIVEWRRKRQQKARFSPSRLAKRFSIGILGVVSIALVIGIALFALTYADLTSDLPNIDALPGLLGESGLLRAPTVLYDRTGETLLVQLENPNTTQAEYLYLELIPQEVVDATLAARDPDFWSHSGYQLAEESPTLAEQLVEELLLWQEPESVWHTWRTRLLAAQITKQFGRETILEWYLNNAGYGQLAFGVDEAAWVYFGKPIGEVSLAEAALLAAAVDVPALNPIDAPQIASERQEKVLQRMLAEGFISAEQAFAANQEPILLQTSALPLVEVAPDFTDLALEALYAEIGQTRVQRGGYRVITSVDLNLQQQVACTVEVQLARLDGVLPLDSLGNRNCQAGALLPRLSREAVLEDVAGQAGAVVLSPETGEVLALAGDVDTPHQAGTIMSPFIYLTAFTRGLSPASLVWDIPASLPPGLEAYTNLDNTFHGPMRIRTAFAHQYIVPVLSTLRQIGAANAWRAAEQSGLASLQEAASGDEYAPFLETGKVSLLEVSHAFAMFANQGSLMGGGASDGASFAPILILSVVDGNGEAWDVQTRQTKVVTTPQLAYLVTDMLSDEETRQASLGNPNVLQISRPVAVMMGQGLTEESTWTAGYTPDMVVAVWAGFSDVEELAGGTNLSPLVSAGIWNALMKTVTQGTEIATFSEPIGITHQIVCDPSGLLPTEECPDTVDEIFIAGNVPLYTDNLYRTFLINTQTGRLATIYTPTEFLEEKVYLVVPQEAQEWALAEGLEIPPDQYDVVFNPSSTNENVNLTVPEIFSYVSGEVEISGTAAGEDFAFYRLQIGEGLNPRQWLQIGEDSTTPVADGVLGTWDTSSLEGLYAIRLQVVREDQSVETTAIQVTVDNQPPTVQILAPSSGQVFSYPEERQVTFQAQVDDNLGIARVEFWVNGSMVSNQSDPPYAATWRGSLGTHELEVRAIDLAGNVSVELVTFTLEE